jgi:hypothetical protein
MYTPSQITALYISAVEIGPFLTFFFTAQDNLISKQPRNNQGGMETDQRWEKDEDTYLARRVREMVRLMCERTEISSITIGVSFLCESGKKYHCT